MPAQRYSEVERCCPQGGIDKPDINQIQQRHESSTAFLNFPGNTEEAFTFYRSVFGVEWAAVIRFRDMGGAEMGVPEADLDKIMHMAMPLGPNMLMATDSLESLGQKLVVGNNYSIMIETESMEETTRLFDGLSDGGKVDMELQGTEWAESFGVCSDRFGIQWMISYPGNVQYVPPGNS